MSYHSLYIGLIVLILLEIDGISFGNIVSSTPTANGIQVGLWKCTVSCKFTVPKILISLARKKYNNKFSFNSSLRMQKPITNLERNNYNTNYKTKHKTPENI
jgi:hypothetical protein